MTPCFHPEPTVCTHFVRPVENDLRISTRTGTMQAMSNDLGITTHPATPSATRVRRAGWRDPRLWIGVLLVTASVVVAPVAVMTATGK
jgi:hypothetical protein